MVSRDSSERHKDSKPSFSSKRKSKEHSHSRSRHRHRSRSTERNRKRSLSSDRSYYSPKHRNAIKKDDIKIRDKLERTKSPRSERTNSSSRVKSENNYAPPDNKRANGIKNSIDEENKMPSPDLKPSGNLDEYTNTYKGIKINYNEPSNADIPKVKWRLYRFKEEETMKPWFIHRQSAYLIGRDHRVVDIPIDHPSCSSQHAVIQYRRVNVEVDKDGTRKSHESVVKPYLMDLNSTNGTFINNEKIESHKYYELLNNDIIRFAFSTREYIVLSEEFAKCTSSDDDSLE